ncbi:MAG: hypothetical protein KME07_24080 [Pegethrix bostrychoides GSE-TBD4-15B]|jgi:hypothetical protein|uniref:Uncharacterized protein n=1 Tax=Pegethrix bostrychoides GSE-TBD4-15B TaxID=2839662 RepID=A0A951PF58_9CYAN|nr:hypothetical protein [Pegethrix bostrychoides GSE-TBD4-15B]
MAVELSLLKQVLEEYCRLTIFQNQEFRTFAKLNWNCSFSSIQVKDEIYTSHSDALRAGIGIYFGFGFTLSPWPSKEGYEEIIRNLTPIEREDRYRAKVLIRKVYLERDGCNLKQALLELVNFDATASNDAIRWAFMTSNEQSIYTPLNLLLEEERLPDNFLIAKLNDKKNLNKSHIVQNGVGPGDLLQLFLYSGDLHLDKDKKFLFDVLKEQFGSFVDALLDMYLVILMELSSNLITPLIDGYNRNRLNPLDKS